MADPEAPPEVVDEPPPRKRNKAAQFFEDTQAKISDFFTTQKKWVNLTLLIIFILLIVVHFAYATYLFMREEEKDWAWGTGYGLLLIITTVFLLLIIKLTIYNRFAREKVNEKCFYPCLDWTDRVLEKWYIEYTLFGCILLILDAYIAIDCWRSDEAHRLIAFAGYYTLLLLGTVLSKHPGDIRLRPILTGLILQIVLGLLVIKWHTGRNILKTISDKVAVFLSYSDTGASFVYGKDLVITNITFAFKAMSVIFFLSFFISVLYYYGVVQTIVYNLGTFLMRVQGCTIVESVNTAANMIFSMTEAPLILRPYLPELTMSELHAVLAGGFASVAGSVLGAFISFGISPTHLITSCIMTAPCTLCLSKLAYPEIEVSRTAGDTMIVPQSEHTGVLDAASAGASMGIAIVLNIIANIIAFLSFVHFVNQIIGFYGDLIGIKDATLQGTLSYVIRPLCFLMGVPWNECLLVGELIALKVILNEFVAYRALGDYINGTNPNNQQPCPPITKRAEAIATYTLCGFANPGSIGIVLSAFTVLAPTRREDVFTMIIRSFFTGTAASFLNACIAGLLVRDEDF